MAKIRDFLDGLELGKTYTDQELRTRGTEFGLTGEQVDALVSHETKKIRKVIKDDGDGDTKGQLLRVVM